MTVAEALEIAISHIDHMAAWIAMRNRGQAFEGAATYSFEALGEDMPAIRTASMEIGQDQELVARIKRSSKYWGQTPPNQWFAVRLVGDDHYQLRGNSNNYRVIDVVMGARFADGTIIELSTGKTIRPAAPRKLEAVG